MKKIILAMSVVFALSAVAFADDAANGAADSSSKTTTTTTKKSKKHGHKAMKSDATKTDAAPAADAGATK